MGIDFYSCEECGYNFPDCGEYFSCTGCEARFCSTECGGRKLMVEDEEAEDYNEDMTSCILCRKETATDRDLLYFLFKHFKMTHEEAMVLFRKED